MTKPLISYDELKTQYYHHLMEYWAPLAQHMPEAEYVPVVGKKPVRAWRGGVVNMNLAQAATEVINTGQGIALVIPKDWIVIDVDWDQEPLTFHERYPGLNPVMTAVTPGGGMHFYLKSSPETSKVVSNIHMDRAAHIMGPGWTVVIPGSPGINGPYWRKDKQGKWSYLRGDYCWLNKGFLPWSQYSDGMNTGVDYGEA